jgi:hypothetical protein
VWLRSDASLFRGADSEAPHTTIRYSRETATPGSARARIQAPRSFADALAELDGKTGLGSGNVGLKIREVTAGTIS